MPVLCCIPHLEPVHPSLQPLSQSPVIWLQDPFPLQWVLHVWPQSDPNFPGWHAIKIIHRYEIKLQRSFNI